MKKSFLFTFSKGPYEGLVAQETLDQALVAASFDQNVSLFFTGHGVLQLIKTQNGHVIGRKHMAKILKSTPLYGIDHFYLNHTSLRELGLLDSDLVLPVTLVEEGGIAALYQQHDVLLGD